MSTDTVAKASEQWKWGVCGFVSTLTALQAKGVLKLEAITATPGNHLQLVFILTNDFLTWCSTTNGPLLQQIKAFTAQFGHRFGRSD